MRSVTKQGMIACEIRGGGPDAKRGCRFGAKFHGRETNESPVPSADRVHNGERSGMNARSVTLSLLLFVFWLALSGHYTVFLVVSGAICSVLIVMFSQRKQTLDEEAVPLEAVRGALVYWPWLWLEILKSSWTVARLIVSPGLKISPTMTEVDSVLRTPVALATYANSITLTPGTVTCNLQGHRLTVYALTREGAQDVETGAMDEHARVMEGRS